MTGTGAERRGYDRLGGRALRPHDQLYPCVTCTKLIGGGRVPKNVNKEKTLERLLKELESIALHSLRGRFIFFSKTFLETDNNILFLQKQFMD